MDRLSNNKSKQSLVQRKVGGSPQIKLNKKIKNKNVGFLDSMFDAID
jgi:hypothetical protein